MPAPSSANRVRLPVLSAFRSAHESRDSRTRSEGHDASGERIVAGRRSAGRAAVSEVDLQRAVSQDIEALMNTVHLGATVDLADHDEVRRSILNYGFPDIVHRTIDELSARDIGREIETALATFEPRLARGSVEARRDERADAVALKIRFLVRAELRSEPLNVPLEFVADLERDTGKIILTRA